MPFSTPQNLLPRINADASLSALEHILSGEQIALITRMDGYTTLTDLATLSGKPIAAIISEVKSLLEQGVIELFQRTESDELVKVEWLAMKASASDTMRLSLAEIQKAAQKRLAELEAKSSQEQRMSWLEDVPSSNGPSSVSQLPHQSWFSKPPSRDRSTPGMEYDSARTSSRRSTSPVSPRPVDNTPAQSFWTRRTPSTPPRDEASVVPAVRGGEMAQSSGQGYGQPWSPAQARPSHPPQPTQRPHPHSHSHSQHPQHPQHSNTQHSQNPQQSQHPQHANAQHSQRPHHANAQHAHRPPHAQHAQPQHPHAQHSHAQHPQHSYVQQAQVPRPQRGQRPHPTHPQHMPNHPQHPHAQQAQPGHPQHPQHAQQAPPSAPRQTPPGRPAQQQPWWAANPGRGPQHGGPPQGAPAQGMPQGIPPQGVAPPQGVPPRGPASYPPPQGYAQSGQPWSPGASPQARPVESPPWQQPGGPRRSSRPPAPAAHQQAMSYFGSSSSQAPPSPPPPTLEEEGDERETTLCDVPLVKER